MRTDDRNRMTVAAHRARLSTQIKRGRGALNGSSSFLSSYAVFSQIPEVSRDTNGTMNNYTVFSQSLSLCGSLYGGLRSTSWEKLSGMKNADLINLFTAQCRQARFCLQWTIALIASAVTSVMHLIIACWMSLPITAMVIVFGCIAC